MRHVLLTGIALIGLIGVAAAQTAAPSANAINPPATTLPQPQLRTPADQTAGTVVPGAGISAERARALIGANLIGADEKTAGEIDNILTDSGGHVRAAVVEWGGFLGLGQRKAVVPISDIRLGATDFDKARLTLTREQLEALPAYDRDKLAEYATRFGWQGLTTLR